jgi:hypothetical protein
MHRIPFASRAALLGALLGALALGTACATQATAPASAPPGSVEVLIGNAACETDAQCRTIGVGAKACGGPARYVAWSTLRTDEERLRAAAETEAEAQRRTLTASGRVSDCSLEVDPGAYCDASRPSGSGAAGTCRLREGSDRSPAIR